MNFVNKDIITWCHNFFLTKQHFFGFFCRVILFCVWQQFLQVGLMHFPNLFCKLRGVENMDNLKYIIIKPCLVYKYDTERFSSKISTCHCCRSKYYELRKNFIWTPLKAHWVLFFHQRNWAWISNPQKWEIWANTQILKYFLQMPSSEGEKLIDRKW